MARLRRSSCASEGIQRHRRGRGFEYRDPAGRRIVDPDVLARTTELAIPPAWTDVWICTDPRGHLQATGVDRAGRKQYLYHEGWRAHRDRLKFESMLAFGEALPRLRRGVTRDLRFARSAGSNRLTPRAISREGVLAVSVRLLDLGFFRIGSEDYAERNESYGLTTMLREHVTVSGDELIFDFPAKSGQRRIQAIADPEARRVVAALKRRRAGEKLFAYYGQSGWVEVHAEDVNAYIKRRSGGDFTAKDFRTWNATVLAAVALAAHDGESGRAARERGVRDSIKTVAAYLGNTPAVCRSAYIDPRVIDRYYAGVTVGPKLHDFTSGGPELAKPRVRKATEDAVLELLSDAPS
jgi:DNA topoisomerase I